MILSFKTKIHCRPTYFVEKIHKGLLEILRIPIDPAEHYPSAYNFPAKDNCTAKIHSLRMDKAERWEPGVMIDFFINARQKNMFRFAPRIPVISTQKIEVKYTISSTDGAPLILLKLFYGAGVNDWKCLDTYNPKLKVSSFGNIERLAINDGFYSVEEFFAYFNDDFQGKIIHWTNFRYE